MCHRLYPPLVYKNCCKPLTNSDQCSQASESTTIKALVIQQIMSKFIIAIALFVECYASPLHTTDDAQDKCEVLLHTGAVIIRKPGEQWTDNCVTVVCESSGNYQPVPGKAECIGENGECHPVSSQWTDKGKMYTCVPGFIPKKVALSP